MCGIAGLYMTKRACDPERLTRMRDLLAHRGPDDRGAFVDGPIGLAHRRLSIIDLATGHQPMHTGDGRFCIVFNGEIYNYRELREELARDGVTFATHSDTEVILLLHVQMGIAAVEKLNGIFAYAIFDRNAGEVTLVRDRMGVKPLHYAETDHGVAFASEMKALFVSGLVDPVVELDGIDEYLTFRQVAGARTLFAGVQSLEPGCAVTIRQGRCGPPVRFAPEGQVQLHRHQSYSDAVDQLDTVLNEAVRRQMVADVPLGTFCSGGIDSSLITAIASRYCSGKLKTYSVAFDEPEFDERGYARRVSALVGTDHHEIVVSERRFADLLPRLIWHHDLPLHFPNSVHIFAISELARESVTVVLTGEGADELFGGYPRYYLARVSAAAAVAPALARRAFASALLALPGHRARKLAAAASRPLSEIVLTNTAVVEPACVRELMERTPAGQLAFRRRILQSIESQKLDALSAVMEMDRHTYLVALLDRQDRMSMAASIESRVPFLDNEVVRFARTLPASFKQTWRRRKRVLCDVAARYLPREIIFREKSGFGVPIGRWLRGNGPFYQLVRDALHSASAGEFGFQDRATRLLAEHRAGHKDHSELLWSVTNLCLWAEIVSGQSSFAFGERQVVSAQ
jgi:asparagine synthase (glutamine-hydrolysing)